ncbi:hypothetical protein C8Q76DRAFT_738104 [Earliella scabrosa]|nr:hypothetical protein C8Q76DRAFT_738104 [Earliella scabrosa]
MTRKFGFVAKSAPPDDSESMFQLFDLPPPDPWDSVETAVQNLIRDFEDLPSFSATMRRMHQLKDLVVHMRSTASVCQVAVTPLRDRYEEGYEEGRRIGYDQGFEEGRQEVIDMFVIRKMATSATQTPSPIIVDSFAQTDFPSDTHEASQSESSESSIPHSVGEVTKHHEWASDPVPLLLTTVPSPAPRDISSLRSECHTRPFGTCQQRYRRLRRRHAPRSRPPQYHSRSHPISFPDTRTSSFLEWDTDPQLASLSAALRSLGWTRVRRDEDAAHVSVGGRWR